MRTNFTCKENNKKLPKFHVLNFKRNKERCIEKKTRQEREREIQYNNDNNKNKEEM